VRIINPGEIYALIVPLDYFMLIEQQHSDADLSGADYGRHHNTAKEHHLPDRCQATARSDQGWPGRNMGCNCGSPICGWPNAQR
jgi:hypothetical protein